MADFDETQDLESEAEALNRTLARTGTLVAGFDSELRRMQTSLAATGKDVATLEKGLSRGLRRAFEGMTLDGVKLSDALRGVAESLSRTAYRAASRPVADHVGGLVSQGVGAAVETLLPFADGAPFSQGRVMPFAQGGIVSGPVSFPMRGGAGLMGEAGPEAIMPLARGPDGKLGVRSGGGTAPTIVMHITTPDVQGFQRSQSQIAAQMGRALSLADRNR